MEPARASITAIGTALMRAAHARLDEPVLVDDSWGDRLIGDDERERFRTAYGGGDLDAALRRHPSYGNVILRARYAEDALADAVRRGARQYVIIGAGLDSFALRRPAFAQGVEIFEVDHPATQGFKRQRLADRGVELPERLHLITADLGETALDQVLADVADFSRSAESFFAWLGVTPYLTPEANLATLAAIARSAPAGSELVFTYLDQRVFEAERWPARTQQVREAVAAVGEPWVSGFDPDELAGDLAGAGLELVENLGPDELTARYCAGRGDGLAPSSHSYVARAIVSEAALR
jgi:methyltransferase (TIGR00027 family)